MEQPLTGRRVLHNAWLGLVPSPCLLCLVEGSGCVPPARVIVENSLELQWDQDSGTPYLPHVL